VLAAVRIAGQQQDACAGCQDEHHADQRFLLLRHATLGPSQQQRAELSRAQRRHLHLDAALGHSQRISGNHADPSDLRNRQIDEHNATVQHLSAQRHVGREHQEPSDHRRAKNAPLERAPVHF